MVNRLPIGLFLILSMLLIGWAVVPILRAFIGIDESIKMDFLWVVSFLIAGLMCGLTAMLLLARRQPRLKTYLGEEKNSVVAASMHASGLALYTGIPLANFLLCYFLWVRNRHQSRYLDQHGREAICFQITVYLYLMMCLFMAYIIVGAFAIPLVLVFHIVTTIVATVTVANGKDFRYPANIAIVDRLTA